MISDQTYFNWQKRIQAKDAFGRFWLFFGTRGIVLFAVPAIFILVKPQGWKILLLTIASGLFARYVICELFVLFYKKPHPYQRIEFTPPTWWLFSLQDGRFDSFPSQHTATSTAISIVIFLFFPVWGWLCFVLSAVVAMGRVVLGYHDIRDVVAGYIIGLLSGYAAYLALFNVLFTR